MTRAAVINNKPDTLSVSCVLNLPVVLRTQVYQLMSDHLAG